MYGKLKGLGWLTKQGLETSLEEDESKIVRKGQVKIFKDI